MATKIPLVCDSGTGFLKIGYANENFPRYSVPAMVGRPMLRYDQKIDDVELKSIMVGDEAAPYRVMLELNHPVEEGIVKDWPDMELIWKRSFEKMGIKEGTYIDETIMMTEAVMNPTKNREKMAEILFESFGFGRMQVGVQALLSLFAEGLMTSVLLDSGDGVTHCIPVVEGFIMKQGIKRINIAGRHLTDYLVKLLFRRGYAFNSTADFELVREIKEKLCFVSGDLTVERKLARETTIHEVDYRLPDGTNIKVGKERFEAAELLFNPVLGGLDQMGCSDMVFDSINICPIDVRRQLYGAIMISGGSTMFPGFPTRLQNDIARVYRQKILKGNKAEMKMKINIIDPPRRKYNVFIGGGVLAKSMQDRNDYWISKADYDEIGVKCISKISDNISY